MWSCDFLVDVICFVKEKIVVCVKGCKGNEWWNKGDIGFFIIIVLGKLVCFIVCFYIFFVLGMLVVCSMFGIFL